VEPKVTITEPANKAKIFSPVKVCMEVGGITVEPAKKGVNPGKGHHHILFSSLPVDLSQPIGKAEIHMGGGSACQTFELDPSRHVTIALFADGKHIPIKPIVTDRVMITVK
jgi:hypothetical protein